MTGPTIAQEPPQGALVADSTGVEWELHQDGQGVIWQQVTDKGEGFGFGWQNLLADNRALTLVEPPPGSALVSPDGSTWTRSPGAVNRNDWYRQSGDSLHFTDLPGPVTVLRLGPTPAVSNPTVRSTKVTSTRSWRAATWSVEATTGFTAATHPIEVTAGWLSQAEAFEIAGALIAAVDWIEDQLVYGEDSA